MTKPAAIATKTIAMARFEITSSVIGRTGKSSGSIFSSRKTTRRGCQSGQSTARGRFVARRGDRCSQSHDSVLAAVALSGRCRRSGGSSRVSHAPSNCPRRRNISGGDQLARSGKAPPSPQAQACEEHVVGFDAGERLGRTHGAGRRFDTKRRYVRPQLGNGHGHRRSLWHHARPRRQLS